MEYLELHLCETFAVLPSQLRQENAEDILQMVAMLDVREKVARARKKRR
jgi:hypothetical protein